MVRAAVVLSFIIAVVAPAGALLAQPVPPLADRVPADAIVYVGWRGAQDFPDSYHKSHLKAVLESTQIKQFVDDFLPRLAQRAAERDPRAGEALATVSAVGSRMWRHPSAIYFGGLDFSNPRRPVPIFAILCDAGDEAAALQQDWKNAIAHAGQAPFSMNVSTTGTLVVFAIGQRADARPRTAIPAAATNNLSGDAAFKDVMAKLAADPVAAVYVNTERLVKMIDSAPANPRQPQAKQKWAALRDALALNSIKGAGWTGAFDGADWSTRAFLAAPAPRSGLAAMLESKPLGDDILTLIPQAATMAGAGTFDVSKLLASIRSAAGKMDPAAPQKIDAGLDRIRTLTGVDLQKDLFDALGEQWSYYSSPTVGGTYSFTLVAMNRPKDPLKAEQALTQLSASANNLIASLTHRGQNPVNIAFQQTVVGDLKIHYLATPIVRPCWAMKDGVLYAALYPQILVSAAHSTKTAGKTILDNDAFVAMRKRLGQETGGANATSIAFADLPRTAPTIYPTWLLLSSYAGFADVFGIQSPPILLPPLDALLAQLAPAGRVCYTDDAGFHMTGMSPFPGATALGSDPSLNVAAPALMASILLPSLNRARETANRVKCASNERLIGIAILVYSNENKGKYPPDVGALLLTQNITPEVFTCPSSDNALSPGLRAKKLDEQAAWVNDNSSYVYVGAGMTNAAGANAVVLYEKADNHENDGMNILFGDGHVEWLQMPQARRMIEAAGKK
jgi:prepilin-type processing-associated H-X9-DG protein